MTEICLEALPYPLFEVDGEEMKLLLAAKELYRTGNGCGWLCRTLHLITGYGTHFARDSLELKIIKCLYPKAFLSMHLCKGSLDYPQYIELRSIWVDKLIEFNTKE